MLIVYVLTSVLIVVYVHSLNSVLVRVTDDAVLILYILVVHASVSARLIAPGCIVHITIQLIVHIPCSASLMVHAL